MTNLVIRAGANAKCDQPFARNIVKSDRSEPTGVDEPCSQGFRVMPGHNFGPIFKFFFGKGNAVKRAAGPMKAKHGSRRNAGPGQTKIKGAGRHTVAPGNFDIGSVLSQIRYRRNAFGKRATAIIGNDDMLRRECHRTPASDSPSRQQKGQSQANRTTPGRPPQKRFAGQFPPNPHIVHPKATQIAACAEPTPTKTQNSCNFE